MRHIIRRGNITRKVMRAVSSQGKKLPPKLKPRKRRVSKKRKVSTEEKWLKRIMVTRKPYIVSRPPSINVQRMLGILPTKYPLLKRGIKLLLDAFAKRAPKQRKLRRGRKRTAQKIPRKYPSPEIFKIKWQAIPMFRPSLKTPQILAEEMQKEPKPIGVNFSMAELGFISGRNYMLTVELSRRGEAFFTAFALHYPKDVIIIRKLMAACLMRFYKDLILWSNDQIYTLSPEDTGALRASLMTSMEPPISIAPSQFDLRFGVKLFSNLPYLSYVNKGTIRKGARKGQPLKLRHYGDPSPRGNYLMYDPVATAGFLGLIQMNVKRKATEYFRRMINDINLALVIFQHKIPNLKWNQKTIRDWWTIRGFLK